MHHPECLLQMLHPPSQMDRHTRQTELVPPSTTSSRSCQSPCCFSSRSLPTAFTLWVQSSRAFHPSVPTILWPRSFHWPMWSSWEWWRSSFPITRDTRLTRRSTTTQPSSSAWMLRASSWRQLPQLPCFRLVTSSDSRTTRLFQLIASFLEQEETRRAKTRKIWASASQRPWV